MPAAASDQVSNRPNRGARICADARKAAAHVPPQRLQVTSSPIAWRTSPDATGSSSPSCASPSTNGSRRKLVTSSRARVRAALNDAAESTTKSSADWQAGLRSKTRAASPATPRPPAKTPMIAAYASYGGELLDRSATTVIEATLARNARLQNTGRVPADW